MAYITNADIYPGNTEDGCAIAADGLDNDCDGETDEGCTDLVIASPAFDIKPLAGGRISPRKAFTYVFDFDVESCMIGVGSVAELKEDVHSAIKALAGSTGKNTSL